MLADQRFAALFAPGSRAEISIVGRVGGRPVSGQVDRLVVAPDAVVIVDYKTNRPAPRRTLRKRWPAIPATSGSLRSTAPC